MDVSLDIPGLDEPATGRLVSIPARRIPMLNDLDLREGRYIEPGRREEVLISEAFAAANLLGVGDTLSAVINGKWERLQIVGIALSPEYVYEIRGIGSILPDNRRFGVLWMSRNALGPAFAMEGGFNDLALALSPGASQADVIGELDDLLAPYGSLGAYGREDQVSNNFLDNELAELRTEGRIVPAIFLSVAVFLLHIVVTRLVNTQRDQIALLKALGYGNVAIGLHFLEFVLAMVFIGTALGAAVGLWLGSGLTRLYADYFRFPVLRYEVGFESVAISILGSIGAGVLGALGAVRRAVPPPAEAMRPEAPARFRAGFWSASALRACSRRPRAWSFATLPAVRSDSRFRFGVSLAVGILVLGRYFWDMVDETMDLQFSSIERQETTVGFTDPRSRAPPTSWRAWPAFSSPSPSASFRCACVTSTARTCALPCSGSNRGRTSGESSTATAGLCRCPMTASCSRPTSRTRSAFARGTR